MRKLVIVLALALALPALALAAQPAQPGKSAPKVQYVLKGTLTSFTASTGGADGSIMFTVTQANRHRAALKDQSLMLVIKPTTRVVLDTDGELTPGETVIVKVRELRRTTDALALLNGKNARQVIDQDS
jgi:ABC-type transport system substrate-binding protein